jgi:hypothetical protein
MLIEYLAPLPRSEAERAANHAANERQQKAKEEEKKKERRQRKRDRGEDTDTTEDDDSEEVEEVIGYFDPTLGGGDGTVALRSAAEWENAALESDAACLGDEALSLPLMTGPLPYHASQGETTVFPEVVGVSPTSPSDPSRRPAILSTPRSKGRVQSGPESSSSSRGQASQPRST